MWQPTGGGRRFIAQRRFGCEDGSFTTWQKLHVLRSSLSQVCNEIVYLAFNDLLNLEQV